MLSSNTRLAFWSYLTEVDYAYLIAVSGEMDVAFRQLNKIADKNLPYLSAKAKKMTSEIVRKTNGQ